MSSAGSELGVIFGSVGLAVLRHLVVVGSRKDCVRVANIIQYSATDVEQGLKRTRDLVRVRQAVYTPESGCLNVGIDGYVESEVWPRRTSWTSDYQRELT